MQTEETKKIMTIVQRHRRRAPVEVAAATAAVAVHIPVPLQAGPRLHHPTHHEVTRVAWIVAVVPPTRHIRNVGDRNGVARMNTLDQRNKGVVRRRILHEAAVNMIVRFETTNALHLVLNLRAHQIYHHVGIGRNLEIQLRVHQNKHRIDIGRNENEPLYT